MSAINKAANTIQDYMFQKRMVNNPLRHIRTLQHFHSINTDFTNNVVKPAIKDLSESDKLQVISICGQVKIW